MPSTIKTLFLTVFLVSLHSFGHCITAIAVEQNTGKILVKERENEVLYPASLTKMMTAYIAFEQLKKKSLRLNQKLYASSNAISQVPSKLGLTLNEPITLKEALLSMIIKSANDSAVVIAEKIGGTEENFARIMTKKARSFGMRSTRFRNPTGLHSREHVSTAADMAILARRLINDFPEYSYMFGLKSFNYRNTQIYNTNKLLYTNPKATGIKTGYTGYAGYNLAYSAEKNGVKIITIVLHASTSEERYNKSQEFMDRASQKVIATMSAPRLSYKYDALYFG